MANLLARLRARHALCLLALCVLSLVTWIATAPAPASMASVLEYSGPTDVDLYTAIAARVAGGESYYAAAAAEHRANLYPLVPFYTVRPPILAWLQALLGLGGLQVLGCFLTLAGAAAWSVRLHKSGYGAAEVVGVCLLYALGGFYFYAAALPLHDAWAGALAGLAAALYRPGHVIWTVALAVLASCFREFGLIFLGGGLALSVMRRDWREFGMWVAGIGAVAFVYAGHAWAVMQVWMAGDMASPGWFGAQGTAFALFNATGFSLLRIFDRIAGGAVLIAALFGWTMAKRGGRLIFLFGIGALMLVSLIARGNNGYWALLLFPWILAGAAFLPRLVVKAWRQARLPFIAGA